MDAKRSIGSALKARPPATVEGELRHGDQPLEGRVAGDIHGGKVGVNHAKAKNLIGAHQPGAVVIDSSFLATPPVREPRSGGYEVFKCAILGDCALFAAIQRAAAELRGLALPDVENAIPGACRIKADVLAKVEREGGLWRVLNLGHTIGRALEAVTRYRCFTHGEAVGWGLVGAAAMAHERERHRSRSAPRARGAGTGQKGQGGPGGVRAADCDQPCVDPATTCRARSPARCA